MPRLSLLGRHPYRRLFRFGLLLAILINLLEVLSVRRAYTNAGLELAPVPFKRERIYISSIHWNNERVLRSHWNNAVVQLVQVLGVDNVFVSVFESGSWDDSKGALRELDGALGALGVQRNITLDETTHKDEIGRVPPGPSPGWIETEGSRRLRRIPYLSRLRNESLEPLERLQKEGRVFDKILFLNDVVFTVNDVLHLLNTNDGNYAAVCSLDFAKPPLYYDTFALRDSDGHEHAQQSWPYFRSRRSRHALKANRPIPVRSCWNGMVAMPSSPFYASPPLRFRGIPDSLAQFHLEGSECCLIHADNPLSKTHPVLVNPAVRVGYNPEAYKAVHPDDGQLYTTWEIFAMLWRNRIRRWTKTPAVKEWVVSRRVKAWRKQHREEERKEDGWFCLINESQVLVWNGWAHI